MTGLNLTTLELSEMDEAKVRAMLEERPTPTHLTIMGDDSEYHGSADWPLSWKIIGWVVLFIVSAIVAAPIWRVVLGQ